MQPFPVRFRTPASHLRTPFFKVLAGKNGPYHLFSIVYIAASFGTTIATQLPSTAHGSTAHGALWGQFMRELKTWLAVVSILACLVFLPGFGSRRTKTTTDEAGEAVPHYIAVLKSGTPQQKAQAAYWLSQQRPPTTLVVSALADLLGDKTEIDASRYRPAAKDRKPTLGEEAAVALVQIGRPAIPELIHVLKTSPLPEARKNAAWALGSLHEAAAADGPTAA